MTQPNGASYYEKLVGILPMAMGLQDVPANRLYLAGLVPFRQDRAGWEFFVVRPEARKPDLPPPPFQLAKGTRMWAPDGQNWCDVTPDDLPLGAEALAEPLEVTALREAEEELGIAPQAIARLYHGGVHRFFSATTREEKQMMMLFAELRHPDDKFTPDALHGKTAETAWMRLEQRDSMRPNHAAVLERFVEAWKG
jgi:hypothetical protein